MAKKKKTARKKAAKPKPFGSFVGVPGGSTLEVRIEGEKGKLGADGQLISSTEVRKWSKSQMMPGPAKEKLKAAQTYFVRIRLAFLAASKPTVSLRIVKPNGDTHSKPLEWEVDGKKGATEVRGAFIQTK